MMKSSHEIDVELFAGAGGMALGTYGAGFRDLHLYEVNPYCCETLRWNSDNPKSKFSATIHEGDVGLVDWKNIKQPVRLLAAGAPCQPFSLGGKHLAERDGRNLFPEVFRAVRALNPRAVVIENVRGLLRTAFQPYFDYILRQLESPSVKPKHKELWQDHDDRLKKRQQSGGYSPEYRVSKKLLNAADYGVPQIRYRVFIVATRMDQGSYDFPPATHCKELLVGSLNNPRSLKKLLMVPNSDVISKLAWVPVGDALEDLPAPSKREIGAWQNHWSIPGARSYVGHAGSSLSWPSKTIKAGVHGVPGGENTCVEPNNKIRYYTLREAARIQTFPDEYFFTGSRSQVIRQIGNAVPCKLAQAVATPLFRLLE